MRSQNKIMKNALFLNKFLKFVPEQNFKISVERKIVPEGLLFKVFSLKNNDEKIKNLNVIFFGFSIIISV